MTPEQEQTITEAREAYSAAQFALVVAVLAVCPHHNPVQRRDGLPPWCSLCGMTAEGEVVGPRA